MKIYKRLEYIAKRLGFNKNSKSVKLAKKIMYAMRYIRCMYKALIRFIKSNIFIRIPKTSDIPIEVCIVTINKDFHMLENCVNSIRKFVKHPITKISIVSRQNEFLNKFCNENNCVFVEEASILGYGVDRIKEINEQTINEANLKGREGWLLQQLLKLGFGRVSEQENYLVVDTDTVFLKPRVYKFKTTTIFEYSDEWHIPYLNAYENLMGFPFSAKKSLVAHNMLFEKSVLTEMKNHIEDKHSLPWDEAYMITADFSSKSFCCDYDTYGNFFMRFHKRYMKSLYWLNVTALVYNDDTKYPFWAQSLSCHTYLLKMQEMLTPQ